MKTNTTLRRMLSDANAPYTVAVGRTLSHFKSSISQALEEAQNNTATLQTYVSQAAGSATAAQTAETNSKTYAANAQTSATEAAASSAASTAVLKSFNQRWLGEHDADPTTDGNGNALTDGAEYYNSKTGRIRVYSTANGFVDISEADTATVTSAQAAAADAAASAAASKTSAAASATSEANAKTYADSAQQAYENTVAVSIPAASSSVAGSALIVNASGTAYSLLTPAEFLTAVGAAPLSGANFEGVTTSQDITDWTKTTGVVVNQRSMLSYLSSNYVSQASLATSLSGYVTSQQLVNTQDTINAGITKQLASAVTTADATDTTNDQVNKIGVNKTTGLPWLFDNTTSKYINIYPTQTVDAKVASCLPVTGGQLTGQTTIRALGSSVNYTSKGLNLGVELTSSSWSSYVGGYLGVVTDAAGDVGNTAAIIEVRDSSGNLHDFSFFPSGEIKRPDGVSLLDTATAQRLYQPTGDYATNASVTAKTEALQASVNDISAEMVITNPTTATQTKVTNLYRDSSNATNGLMGITAQFELGSTSQSVTLADTAYLQAAYQPIGSYLTTQAAQQTYLPLSGGVVSQLEVDGPFTVSSVTNPSTNIYTSGSVSVIAAGRGTTGTNGPVQCSLSVTERLDSDIYGQLTVSGYGSQYNFNFHKSGDISTIRGTVVQSPTSVNTLLNYAIDVSTLTNNAGSFTLPVKFTSTPAIAEKFIGASGTASVVSATPQGFNVVSSSTTGTLYVTLTGEV